MKDHQNVTLSLPKSLLRRFRIHAASRNQSMTALMTESIQTIVDREDKTASARLRFLKRIRNAPDRGTKGRLDWTRNDLHER